jgi:hypothetical protein
MVQSAADERRDVVRRAREDAVECVDGIDARRGSDLESWVEHHPVHMRQRDLDPELFRGVGGFRLQKRRQRFSGKVGRERR